MTGKAETDPPADGDPCRRRNRPQAIAETIKHWILDRGLAPGDRLPQEAQLIRELSVSKGTIREALKVLETQGMIRTRTGPGGGGFITEVSQELAGALLGNHFFFKDIGIADIYALRIALEPPMVQALAAHVSSEQIALLKQRMHLYDHPAASIDEARLQREAELDFHATLASFSLNPLTRFFCGFLVRMLKELTICRTIYEQPNRELRESGIAYQERLIEAFKVRDADAAGRIIREHMITAQQMMLAQEAELMQGFLRD